jgi:DNA-3-methyladenine glycosylase II
MAPFDFAQTLAFLGMFPPTQGEYTIEEGMWTRALMLDGQTLVVAMRSTGTVEAPRLAYTLHAEAAITPEIQRAAEDRLRFMLGLDDGLRPFYAIAFEQDEAFARVVRQCYGYHQVKFASPFESGCWAVLTQRMQMRMARTMKRALMERYGGSLLVDGVTYWAFPEAAALAAVEPHELGPLIRHERKGRQLAAVAQAFAQVDEQWLRTGDYGEVRSWLLAIDGIGPWSADFVLIRGLGRIERMPVTEESLLAAARQVYGPSITSYELDSLAQKYGSWRGYWAHYLRVAS